MFREVSQKKIEGFQEKFFRSCTGLGSLWNLPQALQGSKAGSQTWENLKNTAQNFNFLHFHPHQFFTCPSFVLQKTSIFATFEFQTFIFNMVTVHEETFNDGKK